QPRFPGVTVISLSRTYLSPSGRMYLRGVGFSSCACASKQPRRSVIMGVMAKTLLGTHYPGDIASVYPSPATSERGKTAVDSAMTSDSEFRGVDVSSRATGGSVGIEDSTHSTRWRLVCCQSLQALLGPAPQARFARLGRAARGH